MEVASARPGYELWRPNREKVESKATKTLVSFVLLVSAALLVIVTIGGWERLQSASVGVITLIFAAIYVLFAVLVANWTRGVLPVAAALAVILAIFAAVAAPAWFDRAKDGLDSPALPEELLGTLVLIVVPVQILLIIVAMVGFNQEWQVEEERPIDGVYPGQDEGPPPEEDEAPPEEDEGPPPEAAEPA